MANFRQPEAISALVDGALQGDRRALARLISRVENGGSEAWSALASLYPRTGQAQVVGITGAPGTGKSTLVSEMAKYTRQHHPAVTVGIVAVDPTSPFSGGAVLGDRIRMRDLAGDTGVFIRSMATRGSLGGLARATTDVVKVLDAMGFHLILIETVGAGQSEVDIARTADTVIVVEAPGLGDEVQAIKAGILEIADILVVNKADRDGVQSTVNALHTMLDLGKAPTTILHHSQLTDIALPSHPPGERWRPPILKTIASESKGIEEVLEAVAAHRAYLSDHPEGQQRVKARAAIELELVLREALWQQLLARVGWADLNDTIEKMAARTIDPYSATEQLLS